jgi:hypothetical protein
MAEAKPQDTKESVTVTSEFIDRDSGKTVTVGTKLTVDAGRKAELEQSGVIGGVVPEAKEQPRKLRTAGQVRRAAAEKATRAKGESR